MQAITATTGLMPRVATRGAVTEAAVIIATVSNPKQTPSVAAIVADRVGANPAAAFDINAACAGFAYGVAQADALIRAGAAHYAVAGTNSAGQGPRAGIDIDWTGGTTTPPAARVESRSPGTS